MKKFFVFSVALLIAGGVYAQGDDPFASPSNDPFAEPSSQPTTQPTTQPTSEPVNNDQPADDTSGGSDPFASDSGDPFGSGDGGAGVPGLPGGGLGGFGGGSQDMLSNMSDSLIKPLRPEYPWEQRAMEERQMLQKYGIREADVFWAKTVWREIDIREKINHPFANPKAPFMTVLMDILEGSGEDIKIYKHDPFLSTEFQEETTWSDVKSGLSASREEEVPEMNEATGEITYTTKTITDKFSVGSVTRFRLKEVWYFDKKHSRMRVDIMGIAPIKKTSAADLGVSGLDVGDGTLSEDPLFWVYYPDFREKLSRYETFNPLNDAMVMSWDDLLESRFFGSYIIKESNPLDRDLKTITNGNQMDALYEGEEIKEKIFNFEHDLWTY